MRPDFTNLRNRTKITFMATIDSYRSPFPHEELLERARRIRHVALDMDGTIYMGMSLFPWTKRFLSDLTEMGIGYSFLTNNPSKSIADYLHKLETLGIEATREEMYTTALATIDYIRSHYPTAKRLFLLGTPSMISEFEAAGFESTADSAEDVPDVVVAAFDMTLTYPRLCRAAWWASQGIPYIATNPDRVCPTDQPVVLVDCGSICKCLEHATGRTPDIVLGKPDPNMLTGIKERFGHGGRPHLYRRSDGPQRRRIGRTGTLGRDDRGGRLGSRPAARRHGAVAQRVRRTSQRGAREIEFSPAVSHEGSIPEKGCYFFLQIYLLLHLIFIIFTPIINLIKKTYAYETK